MKGYLAKYAISEGVKEVEIIDRDYRFDYVGLVGYSALYVLGRDVFKEKNEALAAAEKIRTKKIASLKKQIEILK